VEDNGGKCVGGKEREGGRRVERAIEGRRERERK